MNHSPSIHQLNSTLLHEKKVQLHLLGLFEVGGHISGNKWYKLKYNLKAAQEQGYQKVLTFGGAFSNHIYATAEAGARYGLETIGIIRGEEQAELNPTLRFAKNRGMQLSYMDRSTYRRKKEADILAHLQAEWGPCYIIPEGGTNALAVKGCMEIPPTIDIDYDYLCAPCGTGGTLSGLIAGAPKGVKVLGFPALKGAQFLEKEISDLLKESTQQSYDNWELIYDYHFKGYARFNEELLTFMRAFRLNQGISLERIYTAKLFYGLFDLIAKDYFPKGSKIVGVHTGGLQGEKGFL